MPEYHITDEWIAGFFEGEGCVTVDRTSSVPMPSVVISQNDQTILKAIQQMHGGTMHPGGSRVTNLKWGGKKAAEILSSILPFLVVKKQRALWALEMTNLMGTSGHPIPADWVARRYELAGMIQAANHPS